MSEQLHVIPYAKHPRHVLGKSERVDVFSK